MRKYHILSAIVFAAIITVVSVSCARTGNTKVLSISDIQSDPLSFTGEITINGVVSAFSPANTAIFGIVDTAELLLCKTLNCGAFMLPAHYTGNNPMPKLADEVNITGSWIEAEGGFIFEVQKIEVKRNVMHLLS